jgi:hypothetical protein
VIWLVIFIINRLGLSRRVIRNRGSINSGIRERKGIDIRINIFVKGKSQKTKGDDSYVLAEIQAYDLLE